MEFFQHLFSNCHGELGLFALIGTWIGVAVHWMRCKCGCHFFRKGEKK